MKNIVTASIEFSFKGKNLSPSITIELDPYLVGEGSLPDLCQIIAQENNFDMYSYEYEMMQAEEIVFSNAQGIIADFITDGILDSNSFHTAFIENKIFGQLQDIAKEHMKIEELEQQSDLKQALFNAYRLGQQSK